jgi:hypothetical protein
MCCDTITGLSAVHNPIDLAPLSKLTRMIET